MATKTSKFRPGTIVTSSYRVPPFYQEEELRVVLQSGKRVFLQAAHRPGVDGWLDAETLSKLEVA